MAITRYQYDPLDKIVGVAAEAENTTQLFYAQDRRTTEIQGDLQQSTYACLIGPLAQLNRQGPACKSTLLASDRQRSVLHTLFAPEQHEPIAYTPYGHSPKKGPVPGFNGEQSDPTTGHYLLGNGHRGFNPTLMRFNGPDSMSPFGKGGINAYAYCSGNPINRVDPTGHFWFSTFIDKLANWFSLVMIGTGGALLQRSLTRPATNYLGNALKEGIDIGGTVLGAGLVIGGVGFNQLSRTLAARNLPRQLQKATETIKKAGSSTRKNSASKPLTPPIQVLLRVL